MDLDLSNRSALVTGASQGIGKAIAVELAALGCRVVLLARSKEKLEKEVQQLTSLFPNSHYYIATDLFDRSTLKEKIEEELDKFGPLEILINNSGGPPPGLISEATEDDFASAFNNYFQACSLVTKLLLPGMKEKGYGRIVNILSTSVKTPIPLLGVSNTVKCAIAAWAKTLALEVGPFGITVNSILPGATETERLKENISGMAKMKGKTEEEFRKSRIDIIPLKRIGDPKEIANVAAFLASPAASYVTGTAIPVDGGAIPCI